MRIRILLGILFSLTLVVACGHRDSDNNPSTSSTPENGGSAEAIDLAGTLELLEDMGKTDDVDALYESIILDDTWCSGLNGDNILTVLQPFGGSSTYIWKQTYWRVGTSYELGNEEGFLVEVENKELHLKQDTGIATTSTIESYDLAYELNGKSEGSLVLSGSTRDQYHKCDPESGVF